MKKTEISVQGWPDLLWRGMLCMGRAALGGVFLEQLHAVMERGY